MTYELPEDDGAWTRLDGWDRVALGLKLYSYSVQANLVLTGAIIIAMVLAFNGAGLATLQTLVVIIAVGYLIAQLTGVAGLVLYCGLHQASGAKGLAIMALACHGLIAVAMIYLLVTGNGAAVLGLAGVNYLALVASALFYVGVILFLRSAGRLAIFVDRLDISHTISNVTTIFGGIFFLEVFRVAIVTSVRGIIGFNIVMSLLVLCLMVYAVVRLALVSTALGKAIKQDVDTVGAFD